MTECSFKGCRPLDNTDVGFLVKFFIGTHGLMLWDYQRHDVLERGWLIFYLDDNLQPVTDRWSGFNPQFLFLDDVHLQIVGRASSIKIPHIDLSEVV